MSHFSSKIASLTESLRQLVEKGNVFKTEKHHEIAFKAIANELSSDKLLRYYEPARKHFLECDANGLHASFTLLQNFSTESGDEEVNPKYLSELLPMAYGNHTFSECANIERELLAVVCGMEKFNYYTFGHNTILLSDHKPLLSIVLKDLISALSRMQCMLLRLQKYGIGIVCHKGSKIIFTDHLSRNLHTKSSKELSKTSLNRLSIASIDFNVSQVNLIEIQRLSKTDPLLIQVTKLIIKGWPDKQTNISEIAKPYWNYRDELNILDGVVLKGNRDKVMRNYVLKQIHEGITKCRLRPHTSVYWPGINEDINDMVGHCEMCHLCKPKNQKEPLIKVEILSTAWNKLRY